MSALVFVVAMVLIFSGSGWFGESDKLEWEKVHNITVRSLMKEKMEGEVGERKGKLGKKKNEVNDKYDNDY